MSGLWEALLGVAAALLLTRLLLVGALLAAKPGGNTVREALRLLPDLLRLVARLGREHSFRDRCGSAWGCCWFIWPFR